MDNDGQNGPHICCIDYSVVNVVFLVPRNLGKQNCFRIALGSQQFQSLPFVLGNQVESSKSLCKVLNLR
jgi:hypothetical protein